jgi:hypothetical protein
MLFFKTGEGDRTFTRKLNETLLALALDYHYSKEELLTVYLNNVYLGHAAPFEIRGIAAAADYDFRSWRRSTPQGSARRRAKKGSCLQHSWACPYVA